MDAGPLDDQPTRAFEKVRPLYERLTAETKDILERTFSEHPFRVSVSARTKEIESFRNKLERKEYTDPLRKMTDLSGCRVVCEYESDIEAVSRSIRSLFEVRDFVDRTRDLGVDKMGYHGLAFVVTLGARYSGGRYEGITEMNCEIQVRTVLQDAWAQISHQLVYKNEKSVPERFHRDLNNVASLLEIAQNIFDDLKEKRAIYRSEIMEKTANSTEFLDQAVDFDTLIEYAKWKYPASLPSSLVTSIMLRDLNKKKYPTLRSLDDVVNKASRAVEAYRNEKPEFFSWSTDFITKSLGFIDAEFRRRHGFADQTRAAFSKYRSMI